MIKIDGSFGEGGGAILRQALALSTLTNKAFEINNIRKGRKKSGLKAQHMNAIIALEELSDCSVTDCEIGFEKLTFIPGTMKNKSVDIDIGTAGSTTLMMQALMLPCVFSGKTATINLIGGTDVKWSQPVDYFANVYTSYLKPYADIQVQTMKRGYFPKGGGKLIVKVKSHGEPQDLKPLMLTELGPVMEIKGVSHASADLMGARVADRQAESAELILSDTTHVLSVMRQYSKTHSTGSGITIWALFSNPDQNIEKPIIIGADALGEKGKPAEEIGRVAANNLKKEIESDGVVDKYLADQLVPLLGLTKGSIKTSEITQHTKSNIYVTEKFLDVKFKVEGNTITAE